MESVEGLQAVVTPAAVPFQNVKLRCHKKYMSVESNNSPIKHVQNGVGVILSVYCLPLSQAFLQQWQSALVFAFQMQRVRHGVGYQKCVGVLVTQILHTLLQTFLVDGQSVVIIASAAEQRSERKLRRLDEGKESPLVGFRSGFLFLICTLPVFLSITDGGVPFLGERGFLRIAGRSDRFDSLS
jgi:hypothetical protein